MSANEKSAAADAHKEDILLAAVEVFGRSGYAAASTNEIVKQAKVSKGLLFHYFTNKEKLYTACFMYAMEKYGRFMAEQIDLSSPDFFERILTNLRTKMEFGCANKEFLALTNRAWHMEGEVNPLTKPEAVSLVMQQMEGSPSSMAEAMEMTYLKGLDMSLFRKGVEPAKVMDYVGLALEASWFRFTKKHQGDIEAMVEDMDSYISEAEEIIVLMKSGAYIVD